MSFESVNMPSSCDVLVVGGGVAGVAAAYAAAKQGASVVLLERYGFLGGLASSAYVGTICGAYISIDGRPKRIVGHFPSYFVQSIEERSGAQPISLQNGLIFIPATPVDISSLASEVLDGVGVRVLTHTTVYGVEREDNTIAGVKCLAYSLPITIKSKVVVDTSGESLISSLGGLKTIPVESSQAASFSICIRGIRFNGQENDLSREVAFETMRFSKHIRASVSPGSLDETTLVLKVTAGVTPRSPEDVLALERSLRMESLNLFATLKKSLPVFKNSKIANLTPQIGIRAGPLPIARKTLSCQAVLGGHCPHDGVAVGCWPVERWMPDGSVRITHIEGGKSYTVPADALRSEICDNLWFAGRSFGADQDAIGSARVIGTALGTGYAAGYLASSALKLTSPDKAVIALRQDQSIC